MSRITYAVAIVAACLGTAGCQSEAPNTTPAAQVPRPDPTPARIIHGGLGYSFNMTEAEVSGAGFRDHSALGKDSIGTYFKVDSSTFFSVQYILMSPISKHVFRIKGSHFYSEAHGCREDYGLIKSSLTSKYQDLVFVDPGYGDEDTWVTQYCEDKGIYKYLFTPKPLGRCVELICSVQVVDGKEAGSALIVTYTDHSRRDTFDAERERVFEGHREYYLHQKGIDPDDL